MNPKMSNLLESFERRWVVPGKVFGTRLEQFPSILASLMHSRIHSPQMTFRNPDAEAAMQYLTWALEEMEKTGSEAAARHTRAAMAALRRRIARTADDC